MRLYKVMRMASGWSNPVEVEINRQQLQGSMGWGFSLTADQSMYFALFPQQGGYKIAKAKMLNGIYSVFEELPATVNTSAAQGTPYIEPYEKYVVFESIRSDGLGYHDLYVSFKDANGSWTQSQNLGNKINGQYEDAMPYVSPDGKYLFFNSAKTGDLGYNAYWVSTKVFDKFNPLLSVKTDKKAVPGMFILEQNFPNPFNPSTTIHCRIGQATRAALKVYDVLGSEVKSIFSGDIQPGDYSFKWDGTDNANNTVSGGVYFYRLSSENFSQVRKAIFVK
ncbi:MAG: PD40 domain-containing protein [Ignavibacteriales bacterium]|nr:PD40 domain-containing protein [Ignavibacteriales bacterium]